MYHSLTKGVGRERRKPPTSHRLRRGLIDSSWRPSVFPLETRLVAWSSRAISTRCLSLKIRLSMRYRHCPRQSDVSTRSPLGGSLESDHLLSSRSVTGPGTREGPVRPEYSPIADHRFLGRIHWLAPGGPRRGWSVGKTRIGSCVIRGLLGPERSQRGSESQCGLHAKAPAGSSSEERYRLRSRPRWVWSPIDATRFFWPSRDRRLRVGSVGVVPASAAGSVASSLEVPLVLKASSTRYLNLTEIYSNYPDGGRPSSCQLINCILLY